MTNLFKFTSFILFAGLFCSPALAAKLQTCPDGYDYGRRPNGKSYKVTKISHATYGEDSYACIRSGSKYAFLWKCGEKIWGRSVGEMDEKWFVKDQQGKSHRFDLDDRMNWKTGDLECVNLDQEKLKIACRKIISYDQVNTHPSSQVNLLLSMTDQRQTWCNKKPDKISF